MGVDRRRHLQTKGRAVIGVDDDLLDFDALTDEDARHAQRRGRAAGRARTRGAPAGCATSSPPSRPSRTAIIRADLDGVLVVQGGPGTGKTVVALHRAAYLLYTHRERLAAGACSSSGPT